MATFYLDPEGGSDAADGTTFANRWLTMRLGATAARIAPGDTIRVMKSLDPTDSAINATFTLSSPTVTLASALTQSITVADTAWTASANVTTTTSTTRKEGAAATSIALAAGFTTGLAAYLDISVLDLSGYQQISFHIMQTTGTANSVAGRIQLALCSDDVGATPVDTFDIPRTDSASNWYTFTINKGSALGSAIESIAFYVTSDQGAQTFLIDNIMAAKALGGADTLSLSSCISTTNDYSKPFFPIRSIVGTAVILDDGRNTSAGTASGQRWPYATTTANMYLLLPTPVFDTSSWFTANENGSDGLVTTYSGGWNRTDMSTQTGETHLAFNRTTTGTIMTITSRSWLAFEKFSFYWGSGSLVLFQNTMHHITLSLGDCMAVGPATAVQQTGGSAIDFSARAICGNGPSATGFSVGSGFNNTASIGIISGGGFGFSCSGGINNSYNIDVIACIGSFGCNLNAGEANWDISSVRDISGGTGLLISTGASGTLKNLTTLQGNNTHWALSPWNPNFTLKNCTSTGITTPTVNDTTGYAKFEEYNQTANDHRIYSVEGVAYSETSVRNTASGLAWKMEPAYSSRTFSTDDNPMRLQIGKVAVTSGVAVTFTAYVRRNHANVGMGIRFRPNATIGADSGDVTWMTAAIDTWEQITVSFTPTASGIAELEGVCYADAAARYGYIDDITVT